MKNILIYCNTYYQLLVAIQLQLTIKKEDSVSVILTDESRGSKEIADRLRGAGFFHGVYYLEKKVGPEQVGAAYRARTLCSGVFGRLPEGMPRDYVCDELIGYNLDLSTHAVYAALCRRNPAICCNAMEEGLLSYATPESSSGLLRAIQRCRRLLGWKILRKSVRKFYCFNPSVYQGELEPVAIPKLDCSSAMLRGLLQQVFLGDRVLEPYRQKYIYLPCIYDMEGGKPIGEAALAAMLQKQLGKNDLLVKVHPRDDAGRYSASGAVVDTNSPVPFEVLCILQDFADKVLITTLSGSVLNVSALIAQPPACYYAYPLCELEGNPMAQHFCDVISHYLAPDSGLEVPNIGILTRITQLTD